MEVIGLILFDIDGVLRDVGNSYRLAVQKTVFHFCGKEPTYKDIDKLKNEGIWNNDWDLSLELIKRYKNSTKIEIKIPTRKEIIELFEKLYFGCKPSENYSNWSGFINNEELLVDQDLFRELNDNQIKWGFVSGAEIQSAKFLLEEKLKLKKPPLIAMGDAPDKPNPEGLIKLSKTILSKGFGPNSPPIAYVGDTIADIKTIINARKTIKNQRFISIAVSPPHLHLNSRSYERNEYESNLKSAGADYILQSVNEIKFKHKEIFCRK